MTQPKRGMDWKRALSTSLFVVLVALLAWYVYENRADMARLLALSAGDVTLMLALALGGCAMQGLLRNPLADGSTLGVSSGASLGAALAILSGVSIPFLPFGGTAGAAMLSAFLSLVVLLALAFALDHSLATNTLILLGVVFSMFVSALLSLLITFSGDKLRAITFWTMGNLSSASYQNALTLLATLLLCGGIILTQARALNAMSMGEEYALHVGVSVRRVKLTVMICVSAMIGMSVSVGGSCSRCAV